MTGPETLSEDKGDGVPGANETHLNFDNRSTRKKMISFIKADLASFVKIIYCLVWDGF